MFHYTVSWHDNLILCSVKIHDDKQPFEIHHFAYSKIDNDFDLYGMKWFLFIWYIHLLEISLQQLLWNFRSIKISDSMSITEVFSDTRNSAASFVLALVFVLLSITCSILAKVLIIFRMHFSMLNFFWIFLMLVLSFYLSFYIDKHVSTQILLRQDIVMSKLRFFICSS